MEVKKMVTPDETVKRYEMPMHVTPGEGRMRTRREIEGEVMQRAREFADRRGYKGGGFEVADYQKALSERSLEERRIERGLGPGREPGQRTRAYRHQDQLAATYLRQGRAKTLSEAWTLANEAAPAIAALAQGGALSIREDGGRFCVMQGETMIKCFPTKEEANAYQTSLCGPDTETEEGARHMSLFFRDARYAAGPPIGETLDDNKKKTLFDEAARRIASDCIFLGLGSPGQRHRNWAAAWYAVVFPPPAPLPGGGLGPIPARSPLPTGRGGVDSILIEYNRDLERTVNAVMEAARALLRDPQRRVQLSATALGS